MWEALGYLKASAVYSNVQPGLRTMALGWEFLNLSANENHLEALLNTNWGSTPRVSDSVLSNKYLL